MRDKIRVCLTIITTNIEERKKRGKEFQRLDASIRGFGDCFMKMFDQLDVRSRFMVNHVFPDSQVLG